MRAVFLFLALCLATLRPLWADELSALARLDPAASRVVNAGDGIAFDLAISQGCHTAPLSLPIRRGW
ncbi:MAG: hypothetical protein R3D46_16585 [Defluviimonas denitrificans]